MAGALGKKLAKTRRGRNTRVGGAIQPVKKVELRYRGELFRMVGKLFAATDLEVLRKAFENTDAGVKGTTRDAGVKGTSSQILSDIRKQLVVLNKQAEFMSGGVVKSADKAHRRRLTAQMKAQYGLDISPMLKGQKKTARKVRELTAFNTELIKDVNSEYLKKVRAAMKRNFITGRGKDSLIEEIQKIQQTTKSRAKLIARDQAAKFNLAITRTRHEELGIEEYKWVTSGDGRVRPEHKANNGKIFRWDTPDPVTGHPGDDVQCRCVARPVINV